MALLLMPLLMPLLMRPATPALKTCHFRRVNYSELDINPQTNRPPHTFTGSQTRLVHYTIVALLYTALLHWKLYLVPVSSPANYGTDVRETERARKHLLLSDHHHHLSYHHQLSLFLSSSRCC